MMVERKIDGQGRGPKATQLPSTDETVVAIGNHPLGKWSFDEDQDRGDRPADQPEADMAFAEIMAERGDDDVVLFNTIGDDRRGGVISVTLIRC